MSDSELLEAIAEARRAVLAEGAAAGIYPGIRFRGRLTAKRVSLIGEVHAAAHPAGGPEIRLDRLAALGWTYERLVSRYQRPEGDKIGYVLADRFRKPQAYKVRQGVVVPKAVKP